MTIATTQLGRFGSANPQSSQTKPNETATTQPGTVQSTSTAQPQSAHCYTEDKST
jgi:hypothetical protein